MTEIGQKKSHMDLIVKGGLLMTVLNLVSFWCELVNSRLE